MGGGNSVYICSSGGNVLSAQCPKCLSENAYHMIAGTHRPDSISLLAICTKCNHNESLPTPRLDKKVICLDHFCIDKLSRVIDKKQFPESDRYEVLYSKCSLLVKNQLAVFPNSSFHATETSYLTDLEHLKRTQNTAESLACETSFKAPDTIIEISLMHVLCEMPLSIDKFLCGDRTRWYTTAFRISLPIAQTDGTFRDALSQKINAYVRSKKQSPEDILNELADDYLDYFIRDDIQKLFEEKNHPLNSILKGLPTLRIIAGLLAEIINDFFKGGRKKDVNRGTALDILMVAHTLPYVDAIFVDQEVHNWLDKVNAIYISAEYKTRIYSMKGKNGKRDFQAFIAFLSSIESKTIEYHYQPFSFTHMQLVKAYNKEPEVSSPLSQLKQRAI